MESFPVVEVTKIMKIKQLMIAATNGNPKRLRPMVFWAIMEFVLRGVPYGIVLLAVWELFKPLENPGLPLNIGALVMICIYLAISLALLFLVSRVSYVKSFRTTYEFSAEGRLQIGNHTRRLSMGFFNSKDPGKIGNYLINDFASIEQITSHFVPQIIGAITLPIVLLAFLAIVNWKLALIAAIAIPVAFLLSKLTKLIIRSLGKKQKEASIEAQSRMLEYVNGIREIKAHNLVGTRFNRLKKSFKELKSAAIKLEAGIGPSLILTSFMLNIGLTLIVIFGLVFLFAAEITIPIYIMFLIIGPRIYEPLSTAMIFLAEMRYHEISLERIEELRNTPTITGTDPGLKPENFNIEFQDVTFRYHNTDVLNSISVKIPEHSLTALVGPSGSGKTTMTRLIARFWDTEKGEIILGGNSINQYDPDDLLRYISIVFQDVYLFDDTVLNNIRIGNKDTSMEEVVEAAERAQIHEFIESLPEKYETMIGEGGSRLSGGEKQRISIARALLKDSPIVLLDEATASLDPENEYHIQKAIDDLIKDKTVIIIAHRLNTVVNADNIIVLNEGKVVEQGTHASLMEINGLYRSMWEEQQKVRQWKF
jgi:ATP-binding cassette subfamily B protein